jgi:hypothetical protein
LNRTLYIDIDSTIWPAEEQYSQAAKELFGKELKSNQWYTVDELLDVFGPDYRKIFSYALQPQRMPLRKLYPHVYTTLLTLTAIGFKLHFISHNEHRFQPAIRSWLRKKLGNIQFNLTVQPVEVLDKVQYMGFDPYAWGIIEDKTDTLVDAVESGYISIAKTQPWNLTAVQQYGILSFETWDELPTLVKRALRISEEVYVGIE